MSEMIERVAQRMRGIPGWMPPNLSESEWRMLARAAIAAQHEPTEAMLDAADSFIDAPAAERAAIARDLWRAMNDEALKE